MCWGCVRVRYRKFNIDADSLLVLCETKEKINPHLVPPEVRPAGSGIVWNFVIAEDTSAPENFSSKLRNFLTAEGKTLADLQGFPQSLRSSLRSQSCMRW